MKRPQVRITYVISMDVDERSALPTDIFNRICELEDSQGTGFHYQNPIAGYDVCERHFDRPNDMMVFEQCLERILDSGKWEDQ